MVVKKLARKRLIGLHFDDNSISIIRAHICVGRRSKKFLRKKDTKIKIQKRFHTRGTLRSISILRLTKIPNLYLDWLGTIIILVVYKGMRGFKDIHCIEQSATLFVDLS